MRRADADFSSIDAQTPIQIKLGEIINTEGNYCDTLKDIIEYFCKPLKQELDLDDFSKIFANIEELEKLQQEFYQELRPIAKSVYDNEASPYSCGERFKRFSHRWSAALTPYAVYISQRKESQKHLQLLFKNKEVKEHIQKCELNMWNMLEEKNGPDAKFGSRWQLKSVLSLPRERVCKYNLLIHELAKNYKTISPRDSELLLDAESHFKDLAAYIESYMTDCKDQLATFHCLESRIDGFKRLKLRPELTGAIHSALKTRFDTSSPTASLADQISFTESALLDEYFTVQFAKDGTKLKGVRIFVFDRVVIFCEKRFPAFGGMDYKLCSKDSLLLEDYDVVDAAEEKGEVSEKVKNRVRYKFRRLKRFRPSLPSPSDSNTSRTRIISSPSPPKTPKQRKHG